MIILTFSSDFGSHRGSCSRRDAYAQCMQAGANSQRGARMQVRSCQGRRVRFGWVFNWGELPSHWDWIAYLTFFGLHPKLAKANVIFSTDFRGLWIGIFVPTGLSQFPGTRSLFEFAKYIYCQPSFFFNSRSWIATSSRQLLVAGATSLSRNPPRRSLGVPCPGWLCVTLTESDPL